ncbi:F-box protein [Cardamine amara subsp. amara]|uniref:F-box protein n=1 Tax=Cardamine amara subsp. amara TaxID=228776 RepID=A0ABD0Z4R2_CARAN
MSNLPKDLAEEVLSRVPVKSIRKVRFTSKKWNTLSKDKFFAMKHLGEERLATANKFMVVMMMDFEVYLMNINLQDKVMEREAKLISLVDSYEVDIAKVFHCDGLLLCITKDHTKLVVWNPYWGQTRWIEPTHNSHRLDFHSYAGYDKACRSYKILRFIDLNSPTLFVEVKIYDLNSDSWRILDVVPDGKIFRQSGGVSLNGNTYWFAGGKPSVYEKAFLMCFDFTSEKFGPLLPIPSEWYFNDIVLISTVREEQLAIAYLHRDSFMLEIWITTKIEPNAVSWSNNVFLSLDMTPLVDLGFRPGDGSDVSFFIDEEKKVAVLFGKDTREGNRDINPTRNVVYVIGVDGSFTKSNLGESPYQSCYPLGCSYVPSLVQL